MDFKTPISLLQEYLVKDGILPSYKLIQNGNGTHINTFMYKVEAKSVSAIGKGRSKKEAKQEAAKLLLLQLEGKTIWREEIPIVTPHSSRMKGNTPGMTISKEEMQIVQHHTYNVKGNMIGKTIWKETIPIISEHNPSVKGNPIGALQEYCVEKTLWFPRYRFIADDGDSDVHRFAVRCTVASYSAVGRAPTKQQAKHLAARRVLSILRNLEENAANRSSNTVKEKNQLSASTCNNPTKYIPPKRQDRPISSGSTLKNLLTSPYRSKNKIIPRSSVLISMKNADEEEIESMEDPEALLSLIMYQLGHSFKFEFLNPTLSDTFLCNLSVKGVTINCIGTGKSKFEAKKKAAINTLKTLIVMYKS